MTKWFEIWYEDKQSMISTMMRNMVADIEAGYNPTGLNIRKQRAEIDKYTSEFDFQMERLADKDEKAAERWCYMDLKRRGAIA